MNDTQYAEVCVVIGEVQLHLKQNPAAENCVTSP